MQMVLLLIVNIAVLTVCLSIILTLVSLVMWNQAGRALARGALTAGAIGCLVLAVFAGTDPGIDIANVPRIVFVMVINTPARFFIPVGAEALPTWYEYAAVGILVVCVLRWISAYNKW